MKKKGKKKIPTIKSKPKEKNDFLYELNQTVYYIGGLYDQYKNYPAIIKSRSTEKKYYKWYVIEFESGFEIKVKETVISDKRKG